MKQLTEYNRVSGYLNKIFDKLNETYFESTLSKPIITIQNTPKVFGHVSEYEVWQSGEANRRELNIGAGTINRPIENVVATMLHEMVHIYCMQKDIKDTSRGGAYHNKKFKEQAEKRDLIIEHHPSIGWSVTTPSDNLIQWCVDNDLDEIKVCRREFIPISITPPTGKAGSPTGTATVTKKPSSTRKYKCPNCGASVRATRDIRLICGECYDPENNATIHYLEKQEA